MAVLSKFITTALLATITAPAMALDSNVALNKTVTLTGVFGTPSGSGNPSSFGQPLIFASPSSLTDGITFSGNHRWSYNTVWWHGHEQDNAVEIDLGGNFNLNSFLVQADGNDTYFLQAYSKGKWVEAATVPQSLDYRQGMVTRNISTTAIQNVSKLRFGAKNGDGKYSVSEIQALGSAAPVPEPETYAMMLAGLGMVGVALRKRAP